MNTPTSHKFTAKDGLLPSDVELLEAATQNDGQPWLTDISKEDVQRRLELGTAFGCRFSSAPFEVELVPGLSGDAEAVEGLFILIHELRQVLDARLLVVVAPQRRRQGVGKVLVKRALRQAAEKGMYTTVSVMANDNNHEFFAKLGFKKVDGNSGLMEIEVSANANAKKNKKKK